MLATMESTTERATFLEVPIERIAPSDLNPRKTFDIEGLKKLSASMLEQGVIEPLVVRVSAANLAHFEIVAGERRYRAALTAGLKLLPVVVKSLSDAEVIEHALAENHQRHDVHPIEEAEALQRLLGLDGRSVVGIARTLGVSKTWVYDHLKLLDLHADAKDAYLSGAIKAEHADQLARVPLTQQPAALVACFSAVLLGDGLTVEAAIASKQWALLSDCRNSAATLKRWIAGHTTADIADIATQEALPSLADAIEDAAIERSKLLQVSVDGAWSEDAARAMGVVHRSCWIEVDETAPPAAGERSNERCEHIKTAIVTHPPSALRVITVCIKRSCQVHRPEPVAVVRPVVPVDKAAQRVRDWNRSHLPQYLSALGQRVAKSRVTPELALELLGKETVDAVARVYGVKLTARTVPAVLAMSGAPFRGLDRQSDKLQWFGKLFGLTPAAWDKDRAANAKRGAR